MSVEFIGLPGVGKSWLCSSLAESLEESPAGDAYKLFPPVDREPRLKVVALKALRAGSFAVLDPRRSWKVFRLVGKSGQRSRWEGFKKTINLLAELGRQRLDRGAEAVLEQGVIQSIWSLALDAEHVDLPGLLSCSKPFLPRVVVHVETERDELHHRLDLRKGGRSRLDALSREEREEAIDRGEKLFRRVVDLWRDLQGDGVYKQLRNSTPDDADKLRREVFEVIAQRADSPTGSSMPAAVARGQA